MRVTMLGCGSSIGVPSLSSGWGECDPAEPRNRRTRCSVAVETGAATILVDASPDVREQLLAADIRRLDALLVTHVHADHTHGLDDLRPVYWKMGKQLPVYADATTHEDLARRFGYMFTRSPISPPHFRPPLIAHQIEREGTIEVAGCTVDVMNQSHGGSGDSLGFVFDGKFAYSTDVHAFTDAQLDQLKGYGLDLWIVDCLRFEPSSAHAHLAIALEWIREVRPKRAYLTHMNTEMDYRTVLAQCPEGVAPGHDGLVVEIA